MVSQIKRLWHNQQDLQGAAGLLVVTMLISNILGFLRDLILANTIPLTTLDIYYAAFRLPDFLFNLFILGAISSAFIPVFLDVKTKEGDAEAWRLAHNLIHVSLLILGVLGILLFFGMPFLLPYFVPGFDTAKLEATIPLARILLLSPIFFAFSYVLGGVLNAHKKFFAYALAPLIYNVAIIIGGLISPVFGVTGVAWAVVAGALLHALVQLPAVLALRYRYVPVLDLRDPALRRVLKLMIPRSVSLGMTQLVLLLFTRIASLLPAGSVSIYTLTNNFQTTPVAIFAASIGTAVFPMLGMATSEKQDDRYRTLLTESLRGMFFYMIPSMALLWVLRAHIIRLYLALNHQTWADTIRAIDTFSWFIVALAAQGFNLLMIRAFYARQDTRRPMVIAIIGGIVAVGSAWYFARVMGDVPALSLGFAVGVIVESLLLFVTFLQVHRRLIDLSNLLETITLATLLALISGLLARIVLSTVSEGFLLPTEGLGTNQIIPLFLALLSGASIGVISYLGLGWLFRRHELRWLWPRRAATHLPLPDTENIAGDEGLA